jgi:hypothetical protein
VIDRYSRTLSLASGQVLPSLHGLGRFPNHDGENEAASQCVVSVDWLSSLRTSVPAAALLFYDLADRESSGSSTGLLPGDELVIQDIQRREAESRAILNESLYDAIPVAPLLVVLLCGADYELARSDLEQRVAAVVQRTQLIVGRTVFVVPVAASASSGTALYVDPVEFLAGIERLLAEAASTFYDLIARCCRQAIQQSNQSLVRRYEFVLSVAQEFRYEFDAALRTLHSVYAGLRRQSDAENDMVRDHVDHVVLRLVRLSMLRRDARAAMNIFREHLLRPVPLNHVSLCRLYASVEMIVFV